MHINWTAFDGTAIRGLGATIGGIIVGGIAIGLAVCGHFFSVIPQIGPIAILIMMLLGCCIGFLYVDHKKSRADRIFPDGVETSFSRKRLMDNKPGEENIDKGQMVGAKYYMAVESLSAIIVVSTVIGLIIGIMVPGKVTGAIFPVSLAAWYILYRILEKDNN